MSKLITFIFCINLLQGEGTEDIRFKYGFMGQLKSNPDSTVVLSDSSVIHTGDRVRINIGYIREYDFLLIFKDSQGEFEILYSAPTIMGAQSSEATKQDTFATALHWAPFRDPPGEESFYLINSKSPLSYLTKLLSRYESAPNKAKIKLAKKIKVELDALDPNAKAELSSIASRLDKPLVGGVTFRGDGDDDLKDMSLTHECKGTGGIAFIKIVLNHK